MSATTHKKLNLPLPLDLHRELFAESRELGVPATRIVRSVLENWLAERRRIRRREEIRQFAREAAGQGLDLDPELEAVAAAELLVLDPE